MIALEELALGLLQQDLALSNQLATMVQNAHLDASLTQIVAMGIENNLLLANPTTGLTTIMATILANQATLTSQLDDIEAALALVQLASNPVVLPTTPPAGYGIDPGTIADAIWGYPSIEYAYNTMSTVMMTLREWFASQHHLLQIRVSGAPLFVFTDLYLTTTVEVPGDIPLADISTILPTDTPLTWLTREDVAHTWATGYPNAGYIYAASIGASGGNWILDRDPIQWAQMLATLFPASISMPAPVWPGLAGVTLGAPVALATGVKITAPMDGVLIAITSAPTKQGYFTFDTVRSWRNAGSLAFFTDDGQEEFPQTLGFESAIYTVKTMIRAAGIVLRTTGGIDGTIVPWTVSS